MIADWFLMERNGACGLDIVDWLLVIESLVVCVQCVEPSGSAIFGCVDRYLEALTQRIYTTRCAMNKAVLNFLCQEPNNFHAVKIVNGKGCD